MLEVKFKWYIYCLLNILFLEISFNLFNFEFSLDSIRNIIMFIIPITSVIYLITSSFNKKGNSIAFYIIFAILGIWFSFIHIFNRVFNSYFSLCLLGLSDQVGAFQKELFHIIINNLGFILLFMLPIIIFSLLKIIKRFKEYLNIKLTKKVFGLSLIISVLLLVMFYTYSISTKYFDKNTYKVIYEINDIALSEHKLGVINSTFLDAYKFITGFTEEIKEVSEVEIEEEKDPDEKEITYELNITDIDFENLKNTQNQKVNDISKYIENTATYKNKYTGMFKDMNVVYLVAESFSQIAISEELTPTLYKLTNNGFIFKNYYTPNVLSTIGGEFQAITGLFPVQPILSTWRSGNNTFPYGIATTFKNNGYNTYAYHNNSYVFQNRNSYLKSMGFTNFKGCYNGMEKLINCREWPQSDVDMIDKTISDYIDNEEPFLAYYMTVSGHFEYDWDNSMSRKWRSYVDKLPYETKVKAYVGTQIELDRALEKLINVLEENNKLDNTVIVLLADHYPYDLSINEINTISKYERDSVVEVNHNSLIIWNNKMENVEIDKVAMSADVIPTVYNLLGFDYDSRLFIGKDILSTNNGIAIFSDRSWVSDKGTYFSKGNKFVPKENVEISENYVSNINNIVANKINISQKIMESDYYKYLNK